jgi:enoyl-CoA hydratase/carnithine racemase
MNSEGSNIEYVGSARARELYFLPGKFDAAEALRIGLVTHLRNGPDGHPKRERRGEVSGRQLEQLVDEPILLANFMVADPARLPLANHILEDFYDSRAQVVEVLTKAGRKPEGES